MPRNQPLKLATVILALGTTSAQAQTPPTTFSPPRPISPQIKIASDPTVLRHAVLQSTTISFQQPPSAALVAANTTVPLDAPIRILCPKDTPDKCALVADVSVQLGFAASATDVSVCLVVDGQQAPCPAIDSTPAGGWTSQTFFNVATPLKPGVHTVQTTVFSNLTVDSGFYTIKYQVYKLQ